MHVSIEKFLCYVSFQLIHTHFILLCVVVSGTFSDNYDPTIENTHHKTIRFRKVHFATDIIDTAGMVSGLIDIILYMCTSYVFFFLTLHTLICSISAMHILYENVVG